MSASRTSGRPAAGLRVEPLDDRLTPSWGSTPPASVAVPAAFTAVTLNAAGDASGAAAITANETDWYRFTAPAGGATFSASTPTSNLDTVIGVYTAAGQRVAFNDDIAYPTNTDSRVTATLAAGTYFLGVTNYTGTAGGAYTWAVDAAAFAPPDDAYENNDTLATASNLGTLSAARTVSGLALADAADYFRFTTVAPGGTSNSVSITFNNAQGNLNLAVYNSAGTLVRSSATTANTETVSLSGLPAGQYTVLVSGAGGAFNPGYSLNIAPPAQVPPPPPPPPPAAGGFQITLRATGLTANQQAIFQQAANRWAQVITGDLPNATYNGVAVDDVLIDASGAAIDGAGGILGQAGPDTVRSGSLLPVHGVMRFDSADIAALEASGGLYFVVLHEMGHVLGIGTTWQMRGLVSGAGTADPRFTGAQATAAYNAIFGTNAASVPLENTGGSGTRDSHWRESVFGNEVMTGYLNSGANPLSRVTIGALADMGYQVNFAVADAYTPFGAPAVTAGTGTTGGGGAALVGGVNNLAAPPDDHDHDHDHAAPIVVVGTRAGRY